MEITARTMVRPMYTTPHPLAGNKIPLTIFDRAALDIFIPTVRAYSAPAPSNEALKGGLARAVAPYPHLAGCFTIDDQGQQCIHVNNEGVLVVEATVLTDLAEMLADGMAADFTELYPTIGPEEHVGAPLLIQLNRYKCGGLVIGMICHHHVADGHSMSTFYATWASAVRAGKYFTAPSPFLDRAATAVPRSAPTPVFDHRSIEFKGGDGDMIQAPNPKQYAAIPLEEVRNLAVHFTAEFVADLKARVGGVRSCSTFECLLAHVWKKITAARRLRPEDYTQVRVAVNCRARASPPVPTDFFGNMVLWAFPRLLVRDLLNLSYGSVVRVIRDAVARIDGEYIQSFVDFGVVADMMGEELVATASATLCPDLEVDSWLRIQFDKMDLGTGPPCAYLPPEIPIEGLMVFIPSLKAKGSVDLFIAVAEDHVQLFQQHLTDTARLSAM